MFCIMELGAGFNSDFTGKENIYLNASLFGMLSKEMIKKFQILYHLQVL